MVVWTMSDDPTYETPAVPEMDNAGFDATSLTPSDVPYIGPEPDDEPPAPDYRASEAMGDEPAPTPLRGRARRARKGDANKDAGKTRVEVPKVRAGGLVKPLREFYTSLGTVLVPFDPACGTALIENAENCAKSLDTLAQQNDAVRRALIAMTQTSAWGGVMIAHAPIMLMILLHHGPKDVSERVAPLAAMMSPGAFTAGATMPQEASA